jgi:AbrB family looped-hinge helix DNA binding protein
VLPKRVRELLGIRPGDEVVVEAADGEARVRPLPAATRLRGMLRDGASTSDLEAEHRAELKRDDARKTRRGG